MTDFIICVATNLFRIYLISKFIHIFLETKGNTSCGDRAKHILVYGVFFVMNTTLYLTFHMVWVNIICNLAGIAIIVLMYTRSMKMILFVTCSVYLINMGCSTVAILPFINYRDGLGFNQIYEVFDVFLILICELVTEKIMAVQRKTENVRSISIGLVPLCSIGMLCALIYTKSSTETGLVIVSSGLILVNFFIFYLYNMVSEGLVNQYENEMLRREVLGYANQLDVMLKGEEMVKSLRHDMKHHMNELKILASKGENRAIEEYIKNMEEFVTNPDEIVSSGNLEIDCLMNYMLHKAKEELNTVNVKVRLPEAASHSFDINVILGNLLENSIEAAKQTKEKRLDVSIEMQQGVLRIQIENSYVEKLPNTIYNKKTKGPHGIGLENVRKVVEKYDGIMEICPDKDVFRVMVILYIS